MKKKQVPFFLIAFIVIVIDQVLKFIIRNAMTLRQSIPVIKNVFHITYGINYGAGFGILKEQTWLLIWFSVMVIGIILYLHDRVKGKTAFFTALVLGGVVGNLIDRLAFGHVIDFIDFRIWPVFNIADAALTIGAVGLIVYFIKKSRTLRTHQRS